MLRMLKPIFWTFLFLVMILALDQFLVQIPPVHPAHAAVSNFYRDFRNRLIDMASGNKQAAPKTIEAVIEKQREKQAMMPQKIKQSDQAQAPATPRTSELQRYLYSDGKGELHFTDSLEEVPDEYRGQAQPLGQ